MTTTSMPGAGSSAPSAPDFDPVPIRSRRDGWTAERQRVFIAELRRTRSITGAARAAGMSRVTAYDLRKRPGAGSFAAAWDAAVALAPCRGAGHPDMLWHRAFYGVAKPIIRGGKEVGMIVKPDNEALLKLYDRFERLARNIDRRGSLR
jgi:ribosomal protein S18 acetylase RimI-like enzyme